MLGCMRLVFINSFVNFFATNIMISGLGLFAFNWGGISLVYGFNWGVWSGWLVYAIFWARFKDWDSVKLNDGCKSFGGEPLDPEETMYMRAIELSKCGNDEGSQELEKKLIG
jgi:hypothetical protein